MSQSPEGSAGDFHWKVCAIGRVDRATSQSPEGSAGDFHLFRVDLEQLLLEVSIPRRVRRRFPRHALRTGRGRRLAGLNPPKGPPAISTLRPQSTRSAMTKKVSIPRRVRRRFPQGRKEVSLISPRSLNPPKGPPAISTSGLQSDSDQCSQDCLNPPKGPPAISTSDQRGDQLQQHIVSIPRRVRRRFPPVQVLAEHLKANVSIPRRVRRRFPPREYVVEGGLDAKRSQSPEGSAGDFHEDADLAEERT